MKLAKTVMMMALVLGSTFAFAAGNEEVMQPQLGLWERFCLNEKIGDACGRAVKSLGAQISQSDSETPALRARLQAAAEFGCTLNDATSCTRMKDTSVESVKADHLAQQSEDEE